MKTNHIKNTVVTLILAVHQQLAFSQGFANLDFENPVLPLMPNGAQIPTTNAIPFWTAYYSSSLQGTSSTPVIFYDGVSIGGAAIALEDANAPSGGGPLPIQGQYSVLLEGSSSSTPTAASIGQTGQIPLTALSLLFYLSLDSSLQVTFNGQLIPLVQIGSTPNYDIMGGNISAIAGQTGQLLFTALPNGGYGLLDNIQFSSTAVPEPSVLGLSALGGVFLAWRRWKARAI
jgi:hypothetical protein